MGFRFNEIFQQIIKSGDNTQFWQDTWAGSEKLKIVYPGLYEIEMNKTCTVSERIVAGKFMGKWKKRPLTSDLAAQVDGISAAIGPVSLQLGEDKFSCQLAPDGIYQVNLPRRKIDTQPSISSNNN